jgi:hypothetical protein
VEEHQLISDAIRKGLTVQAHNQARAHRVRARDARKHYKVLTSSAKISEFKQRCYNQFGLLPF